MSILDAIKYLSSSDWGSPLNYDITVNRSGADLDTTYLVNPNPPTPLDSAVNELFGKTPINLDALFTGEDPFKTDGLPF